MFKLSHGEQQRAAAPAKSHVSHVSHVSTERRGPNRAKNVARIAPKATSRTEESGTGHAAAPAKKTGTDDEWTSF